jgi:hypothetical protein
MCESCLQHDIRLERNDIIALVNTLQQVAPFPFPVRICTGQQQIIGRNRFLFSFPKRFVFVTGSLQWRVVKMIRVMLLASHCPEYMKINTPIRFVNVRDGIRCGGSFGECFAGKSH